MKSKWDVQEAAALENDLLALRVYSSRLLGQEPDLVLHGGGNTSVKVHETDFFGEEVEVLYVKGSGWDLGTIEKAGFSPVRLDVLQRLATFETLSDSDIVKQQRLALLDPDAPNPSVEATLHAVIPKRFVDHSHADAAVTLTNTPDANRLVEEVYGDRVLVVPYVMPGFTLARAVFEQTRDADWDALDGLLLLNHGLFTFADDARESYEAMLELATLAEAYLEKNAPLTSSSPPNSPDLTELARLRLEVSKAAEKPFIGAFDTSPEAVALATAPDVEAIATRGPLTPDHVIRTKPKPLVVIGDIEKAVAEYVQDYRAYFQRHADGETMLDPAPRWVILKGIGAVYLDKDVKGAHVVRDIARHTSGAILRAEKLGGWQTLGEEDLFEMEYWELEQAKLAKAKAALPFAGRVALVTGGGQRYW